MQSLHDWHRRSAGPVKAARSSEFEINSELVHLDRPEPRVGVDCHVSGYGIGQAELIGRCNAIDQKSRLVAASDRVDDCCVIRIGRLPCEPVNAWNIVESAVNAPDGVRGGQALQDFVNGCSWPHIQEVIGGPNACRIHPVEDLRSEVERWPPARTWRLSDICSHFSARSHGLSLSEQS